MEIGNLSLSRRCGEKIIVGQAGDVLTGPIVFTPAVEIRFGSVRAGVECQKDIAIWREELVEKVEAGE